MSSVDLSERFFRQVDAYRARTYRLRPALRLKSPDDAVRFVEERGFIFFWPIQGVELPSLWAAVAGDRPVPSEHDDPGHISWGWKDALLGSRRWYYAKALRGRATIISMEVAPYFYALSENYGAPEEDYLQQYEQGRMPLETKNVYEALLQEGPLDTIALRRAARLTSRESDHRFNRALTELQVDFKILPVGVAQAGAWHYAYIYDLVPRHFPDLPEKARFIGERTATAKLLELYFRSVGAVPLSQIGKVFRWSVKEREAALERLGGEGVLTRGLRTNQSREEWVALAELLEPKVRKSSAQEEPSPRSTV
ncbi:MAG TPA: crosslink repair DNA glycosylase YcaQ family protein [Anaerolineales bacterium]|nr:crosslink repair DNA glycosylase YcaQ family protein [Anaerolineales bacterium]